MSDARRTAVEDLIARVALGDRAAFDALYEATSARLYAVCLSMLRDRPEAEDTLQEIYISIWRNAPRYAANGLSPMTWLITIARNRAIDRLRARASRPVSGADAAAAALVPAPGPSPEAAAIRAQERSLLAQCLNQLEPGQADVLRAVYLEGLSYADLAARDGVPVNTLRSWLRRGLMRLRECLGP